MAPIFSFCSVHRHSSQMDNITLDSGEVDDLELLILIIELNRKPSAHAVRISRLLISTVGRCAFTCLLL